MKHTIKVPTTVRELGVLAEQLHMDLLDVLDWLAAALGADWWNNDHEDLTVEFPPATPPEGYELAEGVSDLYLGPEIVKRGWIVTATWNATTDTHSLELWMADHEPPRYSNLSPADGFDLAADLITAARTVLTAAGNESDK